MRILFFAFLFSYGTVADANSDLSKILGTFHSSEGAVFATKLNGKAMLLKTNAELSRYGLCKAPLLLTTTNFDSNDGFAEARFEVDRAACPGGTDGPVTLHYNRTIFGDDVFLVDVVVRKGHGRDRGQTMRWHLRKMN